MNKSSPSNHATGPLLLASCVSSVNCVCRSQCAFSIFFEMNKRKKMKRKTGAWNYKVRRGNADPRTSIVVRLFFVITMNKSSRLLLIHYMFFFISWSAGDEAERSRNLSPKTWHLVNSPTEWKGIFFLLTLTHAPRRVLYETGPISIVSY